MGIPEWLTHTPLEAEEWIQIWTEVMNAATQAPSYVLSFLDDSSEDKLCSDSRGLRRQAEVRLLGNGQRKGDKRWWLR